MYVLQRNGDVFEMRQEAKAEPKGPASGLLLSGMSAGSVRRQDVWKTFIKTGRISDPTLPLHITASWQRCRHMGVDPLLARCREFTAMAQIEPQADLYAELATDVERQVYEQIRGKDLLITVAESNGRILRTCGDKNVLLQADRLYFGPGAVWSEASVGTNAISLALTDGAPTQVMGEEHFCNSHQTWGCSAAPIFTPFGGLWGCFDISGPTSADHSQALWLVIGAAREIERLLLNASLANMENKTRALLNTLFSSMPIGMLMADSEGVITYANALAERLLRQTGDLRGCRTETLFDCAACARARLQSLDPEGMPIRCLANPGLSAQIVPFISDRVEKRHFIITLQTEAPFRPAPAAPPDRRRGDAACPFDGILRRSSRMARVTEQARHMAQSPAAILLHGETGTGKDLFARALHQASPRADGPFVAVNCGALPRELIQSELFGYERGAFTGAAKEGRPGQFELAHRGTLFLDEISEMPLEMQVNLLRPLEEHRVVRVGGKQSIQVDFRLITATNRNLDQLIAAGTFRADLFYRIHVLALEIPPLRERKEDISLIAEHHCRRLCRNYGLPFGGLSAEALRLMESYDWPGNVRQLAHSMEFAVNMAQGGRILPEHLPAHVHDQGKVPLPGRHAAAALPDMADFNLGSLEAHAIKAALTHHKGNMLQAAKALGIGRNTLYAKLRKISPQN